MKRRIFGIRGQIVVCFIVPVFFVIFVGLFSYGRAEAGMKEKYTESTVQTLNTIVEYIDYGCEMIESEAFKYAFDSQLSQYYMGILENNASKRSETLNNAKNSIRTSAVVNPMIQGIYIVTGQKLDMLTSGNESQRKGFLEEWIEAESVVSGWTDTHPYMDEELGLTPQDYILSYFCLSDGGKACVTIDIKQEQIREILKKLDLGEDGMAAFVTENGKEVWTDSASGRLFYELPFYQAALQSGENAGASFEKIDQQSYLFLYSKSAKTGAVVCALVPEKTVVSQAVAIRSMTLLFVIAASVLALLLGFLISERIQRNMKRVVNGMGEVARGNLSVSVKVKGRDEFVAMADSMNGMVMGTGKLVRKVKNAVDQLEHSTGQVSMTAGEIGRYSENITDAITEICKGMEIQAACAGRCLEKTNGLSEDIRVVSKEVDQVEKQIDQTADRIRQGMEAIRSLNQKSELANAKTLEVENSMQALREQTGMIENFVNLIQEIAEQTNLLSLNASIEAARVGEAGRGFAVVAEEIRKLAEGSRKAAAQISQSVGQIQGQMEFSVESTRKSGEIVREQTDSVRQMLTAFVQMKNDMEQMFETLSRVAATVEHADRGREGTLEAIETISGIVQQTTASMETLGDIAGKLRQYVRQLDGMAGMLEGNMHDLTCEVLKFRLEDPEDLHSR